MEKRKLMIKDWTLQDCKSYCEEHNSYEKVGDSEYCLESYRCPLYGSYVCADMSRYTQPYRWKVESYDEQTRKEIEYQIYLHRIGISIIKSVEAYYITKVKSAMLTVQLLDKDKKTILFTLDSKFFPPIEEEQIIEISEIKKMVEDELSEEND